MVRDLKKRAAWGNVPYDDAPRAWVQHLCLTNDEKPPSSRKESKSGNCIHGVIIIIIIKKGQKLRTDSKTLPLTKISEFISRFEIV